MPHDYRNHYRMRHLRHRCRAERRRRVNETTSQAQQPTCLCCDAPLRHVYGLVCWQCVREKRLVQLAYLSHQAQASGNYDYAAIHAELKATIERERASGATVAGQEATQ